MREKIKKNFFGFTLIEFVVYISVASLILIALISFTLAILNMRQKQLAYQEVRENGAFILKEMLYQIENAQSIVKEDSVFDTNPGVLKLTTPSGEEIVFDTQEREIDLGGKSIFLRSLRMKEGDSEPVFISTKQVNVKNIVFKNLSPGEEVRNIQINLSLEFINPEKEKSYQAELSWQTSANLRL